MLHIARQKVQGPHLICYIVDQLPFPPLETFAWRIGSQQTGALVWAWVLRLT